MRARHSPGAASAPVIRGLALQAKPHTLVRPMKVTAIARQPAETAPGPAGQTGQSALVPAAYEAAFEQGLKRGRDEGHVAGEAQAEELGRIALQAARESAAAAGHAEGLRRGLSEGRAEAAQQIERQRHADAELNRARLARLEALVDSASSAYDEALAIAEDDLVAMAFEVICNQVGMAAAIPETTRSLVSELLSRRARKAGTVVHVHPDDIALILADMDPAQRDDMRWTADESVQLGGVILRSSEGSLDARLETQLASLRDSLLRLRAERRGASAARRSPARKATD